MLTRVCRFVHRAPVARSSRRGAEYTRSTARPTGYAVCSVSRLWRTPRFATRMSRSLCELVGVRRCMPWARTAGLRVKGSDGKWLYETSDGPSEIRPADDARTVTCHWCREGSRQALREQSSATECLEASSLVALAAEAGACAASACCVNGAGPQRLCAVAPEVVHVDVSALHGRQGRPVAAIGDGPSGIATRGRTAPAANPER